MLLAMAAAFTTTVWAQSAPLREVEAHLGVADAGYRLRTVGLVELSVGAGLSAAGRATSPTQGQRLTALEGAGLGVGVLGASAWGMGMVMSRRHTLAAAQSLEAAGVSVDARRRVVAVRLSQTAFWGTPVALGLTEQALSAHGYRLAWSSRQLARAVPVGALLVQSVQLAKLYDGVARGAGVGHTVGPGLGLRPSLSVDPAGRARVGLSGQF